MKIIIKALKNIREEAKTASFWIAYVLGAISCSLSLYLLKDHSYKWIVSFIIFSITDRTVRWLINKTGLK